MTVTFQREKFAHAYQDAEPLMADHYEEISAHKDIPLAPFKEAYQALEDEGILLVYTARDDGVMIGYAAFLCMKMLHYRQHIQAMQDVLYIDPRYRGKTVGFRFIRYTDTELRKDGVDLIAHHVKTAHPMLGKVLEKLGYVATEIVYQRRTAWE